MEKKNKDNHMDERTAMNVEFLRARLLSERIVSKTARQRAEMLSQRVIELEEQLRIVNIQRKKAEKAAEEVLSILETQGITCISGLTDPSTDQENNQLTGQKGNECTIREDVKEDKFLMSSKMEGSEVDDGFSCSDIDGSPSDYNCLSWKRHGSSLDSQEKLKTRQNRHRHRSSFVITVKSSQRRPGKSCRRIKRPDVGSASDNELQKPIVIDSHGDGVVAHSDDFDEKRECPLESSKSKMDKFSVDSTLSFYPDGGNRESKDGGGKDDMDRALEQQAQLIIQFQAMENAQKEWEEKFNETKMSMLVNPEPGNQVNVVENSNCSADNSKVVAWISQNEEEEKISVKDISFTEDKNAERCINCEMTDKKVASDKFSGILSTSLPSPNSNDSNDRIDDLLIAMRESTAINVIETVSKPFTFPPQGGSDLASKLSLGQNFEKSNNGSASNLKVHSHEQGVLQCSSNELYDADNEEVLCGLEIPDIQQEHPRHPSEVHSLIEQKKYDTMALDKANHATQVFTIPSQEIPGFVASRQHLKGSIHDKPNTTIHRKSKVNFPEQGKLHTSLTEKLAPTTDEKIANKELPQVKELPRQVSRPTSSSLGSVLQSLQRARTSLRQELVKMSNSTMASPTNSPIKPNVPIDSSVLFRLPSDSFPQALSGSNNYCSGLRLTATRSDLGFTNSTISAGKDYLNQSSRASYAQPESKVSFSKDYDVQYPLSPYMDGGMSIVQARNVYVNHSPTVKEYFDRHSNSNISASSASGHPLYYPGLSPKKLSLHNELSQPSSDLRSRKPYSNKYNYGRTAPSPI